MNSIIQCIFTLTICGLPLIVSACKESDITKARPPEIRETTKDSINERTPLEEKISKMKATSISEAISNYAELTPELSKEFSVTSDNIVDSWHFVCGDISAEELRTFCCLIKNQNSDFEVIEFEIIGSDAPWLDWIEKHQISESILD